MAKANYEDVNVAVLAYLGVLSVLVTVAIVLGLQVLYYRFVEQKMSRPEFIPAPVEAATAAAGQRQRISGYGWVNQQQGVAAIPIARAMERVTAEIAARGGVVEGVVQPDPALLAPAAPPAPPASADKPLDESAGETVEEPVEEPAEQSPEELPQESEESVDTPAEQPMEAPAAAAEAPGAAEEASGAAAAEPADPSADDSAAPLPESASPESSVGDEEPPAVTFSEPAAHET